VYSFVIDIEGIQVTVNKKAIKNIHLYVKQPNGHVEVSAPLTLSDESIKRLLLTKTTWIKKQQQKLALRQKTDYKYVSGELIYVWGEQYSLEVDYSNKCNSFRLEGKKAILTVSKESTVAQREKYINEWYRGILKAEVESILPKWEQVTGLYCDSWQIKNMKTRWGTCNVKNKKIWINLQLAKKPHDCLEYIILHELAHLKERNHGKKFVAILDKHMPSWRDIRKSLNY